MGVKLVALDIDGTLIPPHGYGDGSHMPGDRLTHAVARLQESGVAVILASGRMFPGTLAVARDLGLATPVICQQGCSVHTLDGAITREFPIDHHAAMEIVTYAREIGRPYEWFNPLRYIASARSDETEAYGRVSGITPEYLAFPEHSGLTPTGVGIISTVEGEAAVIHRHLAGIHGDRLHLLDFPFVTVAVAEQANKGHALSLICDDLGIDRHETIAVGDSVNDAAMLAWAGRGFAMAHADRYALDAADEVLPGEEGALAILLENL